MAREVKTKYAVLGLLAGEPMSGYDIKKTIEEKLAGFWSESYGQIYPVIKQLSDAGLATKKTESKEGKPDRHVYAITKKGRTELEKWLAVPAEAQKERNEMLLKVFFGSHIPLEANLEQVRSFRSQQLEKMESLADMEKKLQDEYSGDERLPFWLMTIRCGLQTSLGYIKWCDGAIETITRMGRKADKDKGHEEVVSSQSI